MATLTICGRGRPAASMIIALPPFTGQLAKFAKTHDFLLWTSSPPMEALAVGPPERPERHKRCIEERRLGSTFGEPLRCHRGGGLVVLDGSAGASTRLSMTGHRRAPLMTSTTFCRFRHNDRSAYAIVEDGVVLHINGDPIGGYEVTGERHRLAPVTLDVPIVSGTFYAIGSNYRDHVAGIASSRGREPKFYDTPRVCYRANSVLIAYGEPRGSISRSYPFTGVRPDDRAASKRHRPDDQCLWRRPSEHRA